MKLAGSLVLVLICVFDNQLDLDATLQVICEVVIAHCMRMYCTMQRLWCYLHHIGTCAPIWIVESPMTSWQRHMDAHVKAEVKHLELQHIAHNQRKV